MNIDNFKPTTVYTIYIAATPEKVWQALTSAEFSRKYFFGNAVEVDLKVGGAYVVRTPDGSLHISGEVIECDPPRKLTGHLQRQLAGADRKARADARDLRDRAGRRCRPADDDRVARPAAQRRHSLRRPPGLARDPLEPEEPAGDRRSRSSIKMEPPQRMLAALKEMGIATP